MLSLGSLGHAAAHGYQWSQGTGYFAGLQPRPAVGHDTLQKSHTISLREKSMISVKIMYLAG